MTHPVYILSNDEGSTRINILEFVDENDFDYETLSALCALEPGQTYHAGGGAACEWSVTRVYED